MFDQLKYKHHWEEKAAWYEKHFPRQLITTQESLSLTQDVLHLIEQLKANG